jgi:lipoprotein-releasing system ATP-binding protein
MSSGTPLIEMEGAGRVFVGPTGKRLEILRGVDLRVEAGEVVAITGESGVGKSTLLNLCGLLDRPTVGRLRLGGVAAEELVGSRQARMRNEFVGFVFQFHHLLPEMSAVENVLVPALLRTRVGRRERDRARELLERVGVLDRAEHRPGTLSGGERQRVALARALMNDPPLLLADEPTGNLDPETAASVQELLFANVEREGRSMILVTHDRGLAARADRHFVLRAGELRLESGGSRAAPAVRSRGE